MKRLLPFVVGCFTCFFSSAQIPNAGFELWDNQPVPLLWETNSRPLTRPAWEPYIVRQDTDRYAGSYAANFYANGVFKAFATSTFPVSAHPLSLSLYYKLVFPPCVNDNGFPEKDSVSVVVEIVNGTTVIDSGYWESTVGVFNYSPLVIPISQNAAVFDSCRITIWGGSVFGGCGIIAAPTLFKVDELSLQYAPSVDSCIYQGVVVQGVECLLINDFQSGNLLMPCSLPAGAMLHEGDTVLYNYSPGNCMSFCMQGTYVDITCFEVLSTPTVDSCIYQGVVVQGVECLLIDDFQTGSLLMPCSLPAGAMLHEGDTVMYNYAPANCAAICMQGTYVDITCFQVLSVADTIMGGECVAHFTYSRIRDSVNFFNQSSAAVIISHRWSFGDGDTSNLAAPIHVYPGAGTYSVCLTITGSDSAGLNCTNVYCDTITIVHDCIDTSLYCGFPLCCDFAPPIPVCGCDSVTYINSCEAMGLHGVSSFYQGPCVTTGFKPLASNAAIIISPNPAREAITITYETAQVGNTEISITNMLGQSLKSVPAYFQASGKYTISIDLSELQKGLYMLEIKNAGNKKVKKFVIE